VRVFISWSGERSQQVARALRDLLPEALQDLDPWMSDHDVAAGARWGHELTAQLSTNRMGILCLTPENLLAPWLLFEAGSIASSISESRVIPYRLKLSATDVTFPLAQFQGVDADESGTRKLLLSLNAAREQPMPEERLARIFLRWWPDLASRIEAIPIPTHSAVTQRDDRALLEEILQLVRREQPAPPTQRPVDDLVPKDMVWRTVHSVTDAEMQAMDVTTLRQFISAMRRRWDSVTGGEEQHLEGRMARAEIILMEKVPAASAPSPGPQVDAGGAA
jgi:TIR domain-containing protein